MSYQRVMVLGNLGKDPEVRFTGNGKAVARFSVATNEKWTDATGEAKEHVEWWNVIAWEKLAEACGKYLAKGHRAFVEGTLRTRKYTDKEGATRYITELLAQRVQFLGAPQRSDGTSAAPPPAADDDIPF